VSYEFSDHAVPLARLLVERAVLAVLDRRDAVPEADLVGDLLGQVGAVALVLGVERGQRLDAVRLAGRADRRRRPRLPPRQVRLRLQRMRALKADIRFD